MAPKKIPVIELRRLLVELQEHRPDICVRYRLIGKMWMPNFLRITRVTDHGIVLNDESSKKVVMLPDLSQIIQFEIDKAFQLYQPYFHYEIIPSPEW